MERLHALDRVRLPELLAANRPLLTVYVLKDDLKHLWTYRYPGAAERFFAHWYRRAIASRLPPLQRFARAQAPAPGYPCPLPLAAAHQPARGDQQQDQGPQADGLRLPR